MPKKKAKNLNKIVHITPEIHGKLKRFVTEKQIKGESTSLSLETEKAILEHLKKSKAA